MLRRILVGIFAFTGCVVLLLSIAVPFAIRSSVKAQAADLQAIARRYPKFSREQHMAVLQARQAQLHPRWRDLSITQAVARLAIFVAREFSHANSTSGTPALADFVGNFTQIQTPDNLALIRQSDCSLTLDDFTYQYTFGSSPTGTIASTTAHYDLTLHTEAGLTTTGGKFTKGCADPTLGISTRRATYLGKTSSGLSIFAGAGYYSPDGTNALIYGTGDIATGTVSTFTVDSSDPNIIAVTSGDLNGDAVPDIVSIDEPSTAATASVSVHLVHADGTISAPTSYPVIGAVSEAATIDDVNGDGKPDVVVASVDSAKQEYISILTGKGDGTLSTAVSYKVPTPSTPDGTSSTLAYKIVNIITADTRGTGHKDIVTSSGIVLLNNGSGSYTVSTTAAFAAREASSSNGPNLAAGDLNNDGKQDLVLNDGAEVSVFLSNGDGTFTPGPVYASISDVGYVTITDLDGDGNADVYVGLANGGYFGGDQFSLQSAYALMGKGDGTLSGAPALPFQYTGNNIADLNNDTTLDGVGFSGNIYAGTAAFTAYLGNKDGTFTQKSTLQISPATVNGQPCTFGAIDSYALGDLNGDGFADIAYLVPNCTTAGFFLATGKGDGTFNAPIFVSSIVPGGIGQSINSIQIADFNHDGKPDLAYLYQDFSTDNTTSNGGFVVQLGNGDGTFKSPQAVQTASTPGTGVATPATLIAAIGDVNGDGFSDVLITIQSVCNASPCTGDIAFQLYLGKGDGTFKSPYAMPTDTAVPGGLQDSFSQIVLADMNGDGHLDVVAAQPVSVGGIEIYLGKGDGTFATPVDLNIAASGIAVADFNGDGKLDVAILGNGDAGICFGNGDGTLQSTTNSYGYPAPSQSIIFEDDFYPAFTADFNHDGKPDILFGNTLLLSPSASTTPPALAPTATQLTASPNPATTGSTIAFTAAVSETTGTSIPTGTVTFSDGTTLLSTGTLASGVATFSTSTLTVGTHSITAAYSGDTANATSSSSTIIVTVTAATAADFSLSLSPTADTIAQGGSATSTLTLTPIGGFNQTVAFTCSDLPAYSICSFSPATITPSGTAASTTALLITTNVPTTALNTSPFRTPGGSTSLAVLAGGLSLAVLFLRHRRKNLNLFLLPLTLATSFLLATTAIGCGQVGHTISTPTSVTPKGTSQITVTATAGTTIHTTAYTLTIQ